VLLGHRKRLLKAIAELSTATADSLPETPVEISPETRRASDAERRQLTVMFVDLAGSTELAAGLDPEDMGQVIRAYHGACTGVVERWDGPSPNTWAMACSPISAGRRRTRTRLSGQYVPGWR
jgi:class 3 adenylate cyclase